MASIPKIVLIGASGDEESSIRAGLSTRIGPLAEVVGSYGSFRSFSARLKASDMHTLDAVVVSNTTCMHPADIRTGLTRLALDIQRDGYETLVIIEDESVEPHATVIRDHRVPLCLGLREGLNLYHDQRH